MGVALSGLDLGVAQKVLNDVDRDALVHEEAGEGVPQIVKADIGQASSAADAMPGIVERLRRAPRVRRREDPRVSLGALQPLQERDGLAVQGDLPGFARLGLRNQQCLPSPVDLFPPGMSDLVPPRPGQEEKQDSLSGEPVLVVCDGHQKPLGLLLGEEAVPVNRGGQLQGRCGVLDDANELPLPGEIEDVPQQDDDAVDAGWKLPRSAV